MTEQEYAQLLSDALVSEIKAEMGRQDVSSRELARRIGSNPQFISSRLDGGNPRTGERVAINIRDLVDIARALGLTEVELLQRAQSVATRSAENRPGWLVPITEIRNRRTAADVPASEQTEAPAHKRAARKRSRDRGEATDTP
ncbi:hypothetical protein [Microbacterium stercoris]|uniref:Uncharacterized protein n=1 Tax=Microbacterium stercoris TaxID=2820289 RepID=A0A939QKA2_9MICO|nr:hypothetical protein [Microbacterium stercoris]MBO3663695.1 hypothetical protein [Microbacterium stercoris]